MAALLRRWSVSDGGMRALLKGRKQQQQQQQQQHKHKQAWRTPVVDEQDRRAALRRRRERRAAQLEEQKEAELDDELAQMEANMAVFATGRGGPRRAHSARTSTLGKLRLSMSVRRRAHSVKEGKEKQAYSVRFASKVHEIVFEVPSAEDEDEDEDEEDELQDEYSSSDGERPLARAKADRSRKKSKKSKKRARRAERSAEYLRETEFFDAIQEWCRRELTEETYESASVEEFLSASRAQEAMEHHVESFEELVNKCKRHVDQQMYEPSHQEVDEPGFGIQTEEILASLVRDCLEQFLTYESDMAGFDALCHDCFHIARDLVLDRREIIASMERPAPPGEYFMLPGLESAGPGPTSCSPSAKMTSSEFDIDPAIDF